MANSDKNILITPSVGLSTNPTIKFNGANNTPTTLRVLDDGTISFEATAGQLFSISDGLTGSIFSVNDISGIPSIEVLDTGLVKLNQYGGSTVFGASSAIQNGSSVNAKVSISTVSATTPGLIIKGVSSQTANLQEWQDSAGNVLAKIHYDGKLTIGYGTSGGIAIGSASFGGVTYNGISNPSGVISIPTFVIKGITSQTASLQEWQNSAGTLMARVAFDGSFTAGGFNGATKFIVDQFGTLSLGTNRGGTPTYLFVQSQLATDIGAVIKGHASQTANLQEWQNSAGTVIALVDAYGRLGINTTSLANSTGGYSMVSIYNNNTVNTNLIIKSYASQTADLQQWQNSAGSVTAKVSSSGAISSSAGGFFGSTDAAASGVNYLAVRGWAADHVPFAVKGFTAQTGDLTRWINDAGTVLTSISSAGKLTSAVDASINGVTVGMGAGSASTNTVTGLNSLISNTTGTYNTAFGNQSLQLNTSGTQNTAFGQGALYNNRTGWYNTAFGQAALQQNNYGYSNTAIGANAMVTNVSGSANTALGIQSLLLNLSGNNNTGLGTNAGFSNSTGSGNIFLGFESGYYETGSNKLYIANSNTATPLIGGDFSAKTLTVAGNATITSQATGTVGLIIKGAASQTANLQEWQDSAGTALVKIQSDGTVGVNGTPGTNTKFYIEESYTGNSGANTGLRVRGTGSSTSNWKGRIIAGGDTVAFLMGEYNSQAWLGGHNAALNAWASFYINPHGGENLYLGNTGAGGSTPIVTIKNSNGFVGIGTSSATAKLHIINTSASAEALIVKGATSQTAKLQEWQNNSGTTLASVNNNGVFETSASIFTPYLQPLNGGGSYLSLTQENPVTANTLSASVVPFAVKGAASQTANLQEWQNSAGTLLASVNSGGTITAPYYASTNNTGSYLQLDGSSTYINQRITNLPNLIIKAMASQTADLQQWQNSAGTVLAKVDASGNFILNNITMSQSASSVTATNLGTTNNRVYLKEENSGGQVRITKSTAAAANNRATDLAQLYLRDGTTPGTLKLVIIAGTAGAETTILDNIPQS